MCEYNTYYKLTVPNEYKELEKKITKSLVEIVNKPIFSYYILPLNEWYIWKYHHDNMIKLSNKFPKIKLTLHGKGESPCDYWIKIYLGGELIDKYEYFNSQVILKNKNGKSICYDYIDIETGSGNTDQYILK